MRLSLAIALLPVSMLIAQRAPFQSVTAVRTWGLSDATRVAIEVSGPFEFKYDRLHEPERVYFDIKGASPHIDGKRSVTRQVEDKIVRRIRVAETNPGVTRVVMDVAAPVDVLPSQLTNPNRLIIELRIAPVIPVAPVETPATPPAAVNTPALPPVANPPAPKPEPPKTTEIPKERVETAKTDTVKTEPVRPEAAIERPTPVAARTETPADRSELAKAARRNSTGTSSLTRALGLKLNRVVLDAGHGGHDTGTIGPKGLQEKDLVLDVTLRLGKLIEQGMGAEVIYTRSDDTFIPLTERPAIANEKKADLFLSIHANSSPYPRITGVETYYLNFTDSKEAMDLAARENAGSQQSIFDLESLAKKIAMHEKLDESREFAGRMQAALFAFSSRSFPGQKNRGVKKAPFVVLIGAQMPAVLAEIGF
ncbi:MAG TPA: N-acetylmuramoyl-L-alanine amidase, partial [Candidatus Solibacter sp.]|nr:N-acetylmuramoyl-L-alanine amidase [Candidatus Solibacter sp.]